MRTFSSGVNGALSKKFGVDPTLFIGVQWDDSGDEYYYSSHEFSGAKKQIISISGVETTQLVDGTGASQSVTVTLSDTDGAIKEILNTIDVHKRPAKVYLSFPGVPIAEAVVLIDGEINSEMKWDDRARTFKFTILNKIEGRQFGFAMEDGLFAEVNESDRAKAWPFRFGETCAYPAVEIRNGVQGILRIGQGVLDTTLDAKICQAKQIQCPKIESQLGEPVPEDVDTESFDNATYARQEWENSMDEFGQVDGGPGDDRNFGLRLPQIKNVAGVLELGPNRKQLVEDKECERGKFQTLCQLLRDRANQLAYVNDTLNILGGNKFPQGRLTQIRIDDVIYTGTFSGETFTINQTNRLDAPTENVDCTKVGPLTEGYRQQNEPTPGSLAECSEATENIELRVVGGPGDAWRALGDMAESKFKWLPSGSDVYLEEDSTRVHVVSLVPGSVTGVYAYRQFGDNRQLTELPTNYYEVVETDYGDLTAIEIHLTRGLDSYQDENWDNTLYVHFDSDIGPNPADVIEWIIENFTDFTVDSASFASAKSALANYPCNYYHAKKENVLQTVSRLAYEARCALVITDGVVKIKYLPAEPSVDVTMTEADLVAGSFSFSHTRTEELVTSSDVTWQPRGADILNARSVERRLTVERNVRRYGFFGESHTYESISNEAQALKTATFWSIRDSNTWRTVKFQTTLEHMGLELYDCINLNIAQFPNVKCLVTSVSINPTNGIVDVECWTPILSGSTEEYFFAWPANKAQEPYPGDAYEIESPLLNVTPPEGHPLYVESASGEPPVVATTGDRIPSDLDDTFPESFCQDMNDSELVDVIAPQFERTSSFPVDTGEQATRADEVASNGRSYNFEEPEESTACGRPTLETCVWTVNVQYHTAVYIAPSTAPGSGLNCPLKPGPCNTTERGKSCGGPNYFICKTFGSEIMARAFKGAIEAQARMAHCSFRAGTTAPVSATLLPVKGSNCPNIDAQV
jgi:hypothetical protein